MNNKEKLKKLVLDTARVLRIYISVHDRRLKSAGTFISLFKKPDFKSIFTTARIAQNLAYENLEAIDDFAGFASLTDEEEKLLDALRSYAKALCVTCDNLRELTEYQYNTGQKNIFRQKNVGSSREKNSQLENEYKASISGYLEHGEKLNRLSSKLF